MEKFRAKCSSRNRLEVSPEQIGHVLQAIYKDVLGLEEISKGDLELEYVDRFEDAFSAYFHAGHLPLAGLEIDLDQLFPAICPCRDEKVDADVLHTLLCNIIIEDEKFMELPQHCLMRVAFNKHWPKGERDILFYYDLISLPSARSL